MYCVCMYPSEVAHEVRTCTLHSAIFVTSGYPNKTAELSTEDLTGRVLLIVSAVVQLLVWTVAFAAAAHGIFGL